MYHRMQTHETQPPTHLASEHCELAFYRITFSLWFVLLAVNLRLQQQWSKISEVAVIGFTLNAKPPVLQVDNPKYKLRHRKYQIPKLPLPKLKTHNDN